MKIKITGKNIDVGDALRTHVEERLQTLRQRYFDATVHAHVTIEKSRGAFLSDCTLQLATGLILQAEGRAADAHASFDAAAQHLERQLKRYKQRLKDHQRTRRVPVQYEDAPSYVLSASDEEHAPEPHDLNPVVIAEGVDGVPELTVGEAVMQLDFSRHPFVLFRNSGHGALNVVYRRHDGNIGWVDPRPKTS